MGQARGASWPKAYEALRTFAAGQGGIVAVPKSLTVPADARPAFYERVEAARRALARRVLGGRLDEAAFVAGKCRAMRQRLLDASGLAAFRLAPTLEAFLTDVEAAVSKPAFSAVLDGLQNGRDAGEVLEAAGATLEEACSSLERNAYEAWAYCGVVSALDPVRFWTVESVDAYEVHAVASDEVTVARQTPSPERRIPEAVFETADGRVFAMKNEAARELDYYGLKIERRRDSSAGGNTAGLVGHRVLMLYRLGSVDEVDAVADRDRMRQTPSDLLVEVLAPRDMETPAYVSLFAARINAARSRRPVQVVTYDEAGKFPAGMEEDPDIAPVRRRVVGFDEGVLTEIAAELAD